LPPHTTSENAFRGSGYDFFVVLDKERLNVLSGEGVYSLCGSMPKLFDLFSLLSSTPRPPKNSFDNSLSALVNPPAPKNSWESEFELVGCLEIEVDEYRGLILLM
ncbi:hypothetical protein LJY23_10685, partial [Bifidobacterium bifidum]|nr:hypothetical protein [Bifidobacterium bifidum]